MNVELEARDIIAEHTEGLMKSTHLERETNSELYDVMVEGCSFILTERLLEGKYTPMQYNDIRNVLGNMLWTIFEAHITKERETKIDTCA